MTNLPDVITIPAAPREARGTPQSAGGEDDGTFDGLMRQAAGEEDAGDPDAPRPAKPRAGAPASADGALAAIIPWLAPAPPPSPPTTAGMPAAGVPAVPPGDGGPVAPPPFPTPALAGVQPPTALASGTGPSPAPDGKGAPQAAGTPAPASAAPSDDAPQGPVPASAVPLPSTADAGTTPAEAPPAATAPKRDPLSADARDAEPVAPRPSPADGAGAPGNHNAGGQNAGGQGNGGGQRPPTGDMITGAAPAGAAAPGAVEALPALPAQAASQYAATATHASSAPHTPTPAAQVAAPLVRVANAGGGEFHIDLSPPDLGPVRVTAEVADGTVTLTVKAESGEALTLLRRDLHQLERALGDAGLKLDTASLQFSLQGDGQPRHFGAQSHDEGGRRPAAWPAEGDGATADPQPERAARPIDGVVDISV